MRFLPYERITLRTDAPPDVVEAKLAGLVAKPRRVLFAQPPEPFRGSIVARHFKLMRVLETFLGLPKRNSWQPVVIGDLMPVTGGTEIRVRMRLHLFVAIFTAVWFGVLFWAGVTTLADGLMYDFSTPECCERRCVGSGWGLAPPPLGWPRLPRGGERERLVR